MISLPRGEYFVDLNAEYEPCLQRVKVDKFSELNFFIKPYDTFFSGKIYWENDKPASGVVVTAHKKDNGHLFQGVTDEKGQFVLGIEPGEYIVNIDQIDDKLLSITNQEIHSAMPSQSTFRAAKGETVVQNFRFLLCAQSIQDSCTYSSADKNADLVKAVFWANSDNRQKLCRNLSNTNTGYASSTADASLVRLVAQNEVSFSPVRLTNPVRRDDHNAKHVFNFDTESSLMTLRGKVFDDRGKPVVGAWIAARHAWENSHAAHLITRSNERGEYILDLSLEGDWRIGVFSPNINALPVMYYKYVTKGIRCDQLNFVLSRKNVFLADDERILQSSKISVMPRASAFRSKPIDYELPEMASAKANMPILDHKELVKLIDSQLSQGFHSVVWDGQEEKNRLIMEKVSPSHLITGE
ncbi:MAG: carboxypeptidase-like regulatory domain-containing protein [candidate division KSB1 bacterium]|nr:carboxypeptidase-like regulatory domain-containing protein [candidate division KSB1 bacterium]